ncbi:MAG: YmfQ family protein [Lachnospiraceae bacterium]|nr:YmfQ family protein [Lachnospiraceae bacterium]
MKQEIELIQYLPEFLQEITEYQQLFATENPEFALLYEMAEAMLNNGFIRTADLQGLKRWEKLLGIPAAGQDMDGRRAAVLGKWNRSLPYTMTRLYEYLDILAARTEYHILLFPEDYRLELITENLPAGTLRAMRDLVRVMLPANMLFILADRIPGAATILSKVQARMRITGTFWPRSNLPLHYLDGITRLDGRYPLSGYLSGQSLDFYPTALQISCEAGKCAETVADGWTAVCCGVAETAESEVALCIRGEGKAGTETAGAMQVSAGAGETGKTTAAGYLRIEKNWGTLDGSCRLDGSRELDAVAYEVEV